MATRRTIFAIASILAMSISLSGCGGKEERLGSHMQKGRDFFAQGNLEKARIELKNVLQIEPKHGEAYYLAGQIEERQRNMQKAFINYQKAVELDPGNLGAKASIGRFYLFAGDLPKAEQFARDILAARPTDAAGLTLLGGVLAQKKDLAGATDAAKQAIAHAPTHAEAYGLLAGLLSGQGKPAEATAALEQGIAAAPDKPELRLALASLAMTQDVPETAAAQYRELVKLEPANRDYRVGLARLQAAGNDLPGAEKTLRDAIQAEPGDDLRYVFLADFLVANGRSEQAAKELAAAVEATPEAYRLRFSLAGLYLSQGKPDDAARVYDSVITRDKLGPDGLRARNQLAMLRVSQDKRDEAARLTGEVLKENPRDNDALLLRARMALASGDALAAIADFRSVLKDQPTSTEVLAGLARAHMANNEPEMAVETIGKAAALNPKDSAARLMMAEVKVATGDRKAAMDDVAAVLKADARSYQGLLLKASIESAAKDWRAAERTLVSLAGFYPTDSQANYRLGTVQQALRKLDAALASYELALSLRPGAIEPLTGIANVRVAQAHPERAIQRVSQELAREPNNFAVHVLLAKLQERAGKSTDAEASLRKAVEIEPRFPATHIELANFYAARKDGVREAEAIAAGLKALPGNATLELRLADHLARVGAFERAIAQYETVLKQQPGNEVAINNLANLLLDTRSDKVSAERALQLSQRFSNSANLAYLDTYGWASVRAEHYQEGIAALRKVIHRAPDVPVFQYHLGAALLHSGDSAAATPFLRKAISAREDFAGKDDARQLLGKG